MNDPNDYWWLVSIPLGMAVLSLLTLFLSRRGEKRVFDLSESDTPSGE